jgi:hypothetical protein
MRTQRMLIRLGHTLSKLNDDSSETYKFNGGER